MKRSLSAPRRRAERVLVSSAPDFGAQSRDFQETPGGTGSRDVPRPAAARVFALCRKLQFRGACWCFISLQTSERWAEPRRVQSSQTDEVTLLVLPRTAGSGGVFRKTETKSHQYAFSVLRRKLCRIKQKMRLFLHHDGF